MEISKLRFFYSAKKIAIDNYTNRVPKKPFYQLDCNTIGVEAWIKRGSLLVAKIHNIRIIGKIAKAKNSSYDELLPVWAWKMRLS